MTNLSERWYNLAKYPEFKLISEDLGKSYREDDHEKRAKCAERMEQFLKWVRETRIHRKKEARDRASASKNCSGLVQVEKR